MAKVAILVLADTETHEGLGRVVNALEAVKECKEAGDDVQLIFDGGGTKWVPALSKSDHLVHGLYAAVKDFGAFHVAGHEGRVQLPAMWKRRALRQTL